MLTPRTWVAPHLPTLVLDEHRGHRTRMLEALNAAAHELIDARPAAIVAMSARWNAPGPFRVDAGRRHRPLNDYPGLGVEMRADAPGHPALARALVTAGERAGLPVGTGTRGLDSGIGIPLHFLHRAPRVPVVPLSLPTRPPAECRAWGAVLRRALEAWPGRAAFLIGGALSHNLHAWSFGRDVPEARALDQWALDAVSRGAWSELHAAPPAQLLDQAQPVAGLRHFDVMRGFLGDDRPGTVRSYESGPGMGGALIAFDLDPASEAAARP